MGNGAAEVDGTVEGSRRNIVALRWPAQANEARRLGALGVPRLLLVPPDADPPAGADDLEVWLRLPPDGGQIEERLCMVARKAASADRTVRLDEFGRLFVGQRWIAFSEIQVRLLRVLIANLGEVVSEEHLLQAGWPDHGSSANNLRVLIYRLRTRLLEVGLELRSVRGRGLVLQHPV
jgi:DNA-binding response OmpR family regulator